MWKENDILLPLLDENRILSMKYPVECPICKQKSIHLYLHRFDEDNTIGSAWIWCSGCISCLHAGYRIPPKWKNLDQIDEAKLTSDPEYLASLTASIDKHINSISD